MSEKQAGHTPGEWEIFETQHRGLGRQVHVGPGRVSVAHVGSSVGQCRDANARLIAAAPDMLDALILLEREMVLSGNAQSRDYGWLPAITKTRAAIVRATGSGDA